MSEAGSELNAHQEPSPQSASQGRPFVSVVIPVYGNAGVIEELYRRLATVIGRIVCGWGYPDEWEIVFVDDSSPDGADVVLRRLAESDPSHVVSVSMRSRSGQLRATVAGLARARGEIVVTMDGDLQDPPEAVPALIDRLFAKPSNGRSVVFAHKVGDYEGRIRLAQSSAFKRMLEVVGFADRRWGQFTAMRSEAKEAVLAVRSRVPYLPILASLVGLEAATVPIERQPAPGGASAYGILRRTWLGLQILIEGVRLRWSPRRAGRGVPRPQE